MVNRRAGKLRRTAVVLLAVIGLALLSACSSGGGTNGTGGTSLYGNRTLTGTVRDTAGTLIEGATVRWDLGSTTTNAMGRYTLTRLPDARAVVITVTKTGFEMALLNLGVTQTQLDAQLTASGGFNPTNPPNPPVFP